MQYSILIHKGYNQVTITLTTKASLDGLINMATIPVTSNCEKIYKNINYILHVIWTIYSTNMLHPATYIGQHTVLTYLRVNMFTTEWRILLFQILQYM